MPSQFGQDHFVITTLGPLRSGYFLDSGASNGIRCSNTELLEKRYGWTGICVEPHPEFFRELTANRSCAMVNCCLYAFDGTVPFVHAGTISGIHGELGTRIVPFVQEKLDLPDGAPLPTQHVACRTVLSVLREFGAPHVIDYWSLDTEGSELTILRSFPFEEYLVRVITVEHNWDTDRLMIRDLLISKGFVWTAVMGCDDVYVHRTVGSRRAAWRSRALRRR